MEGRTVLNSKKSLTSLFFKVKENIDHRASEGGLHTKGLSDLNMSE